MSQNDANTNQIEMRLIVKFLFCNDNFLNGICHQQLIVKII